MEGGGLGAGVDLGLQRRQAKLGQRDPLLPTDDETRCIREHSGCLPDKPATRRTCYQLLRRCTVGRLTRRSTADRLKSAHFPAAESPPAPIPATDLRVTAATPRRNHEQETAAGPRADQPAAVRGSRSRHMPSIRRRPTAGTAAEPADPNAAPYPPDGVIDPNAEYPTDGSRRHRSGRDGRRCAVATASRRRQIPTRRIDPPRRRCDTERWCGTRRRD